MGRVSYSQYAMFNTCPWKWKLNYIDKVNKFIPNIHLIFGSSMHHVLQMYLTVLYNNGVKQANQLDMPNMLRETLGKEYISNKDGYKKQLLNENSNLTDNEFDKIFDKIITKNDMVEFYYDGIKIIEYFRKNRLEFFNSVDEQLLGIEFPLESEVRKNVNFIGYIDVLIYNRKTDEIRIIDLKMSTKGWGSYKKSDNKTTDQLVLYKSFYSKLLNVEPNKIKVEFIIFKRKLYEGLPYKIKRIVKFVPAAGKPTMNRANNDFNFFIDSVFDENGEYKIGDEYYPKIITDYNCRFCDFAENKLCNRKM